MYAIICMHERAFDAYTPALHRCAACQLLSHCTHWIPHCARSNQVITVPVCTYPRGCGLQCHGVSKDAHGATRGHIKQPRALGALRLTATGYGLLGRTKQITCNSSMAITLPLPLPLPPTRGVSAVQYCYMIGIAVGVHASLNGPLVCEHMYCSSLFFKLN